MIDRDAPAVRVLSPLLAAICLSTIGCFSAIVNSFTGENIAEEIRSVGLPAEGTVLKIWETGAWVNNSPVVGFLLEVRAPGLEPWRAETKALVSILAIGSIQPGKVLPLKYDPADPTRIALVPVPVNPGRVESGESTRLK